MSPRVFGFRCTNPQCELLSMSECSLTEDYDEGVAAPRDCPECGQPMENSTYPL